MITSLSGKFLNFLLGGSAATLPCSNIEVGGSQLRTIETDVKKSSLFDDSTQKIPSKVDYYLLLSEMPSSITVYERSSARCIHNYGITKIFIKRSKTFKRSVVNTPLPFFKLSRAKFSYLKSEGNSLYYILL